MQIRRARPLHVLFVLVGLRIFTVVLEAQRAFVRPELISGEWETMTASGIHGIHLSIRTYDVPQPQVVHIRVYHRQNGQERWGWWGDNGSVSPVFDGVRLTVRNLDVIFDPSLGRWTGTWVLEGESKAVVLERPTCQSHPLCGTWEGQGVMGLVRLHFVQSADGVLTAWMDRARLRRHGEQLRVVSSDPSGFDVQTTFPGGLQFRLTGRLSNPFTLEGAWSPGSPVGFDTHQTLHKVH
jgi:hypothetical protein